MLNLYGGRATCITRSFFWAVGRTSLDTYKLTQTTDYLYLAGGGIMAHPGGISGGVNGIKQAWEAAVTGLKVLTIRVWARHVVSWNNVV